jgi:hypothetical protein
MIFINHFQVMYNQKQMIKMIIQMIKNLIMNIKEVLIHHHLHYVLLNIKTKQKYMKIIILKLNNFHQFYH